MSLLVWFLYCAELSLLAMTYSVMASFIQPPLSQSALLNSTATFSCVATDVRSVTYLVSSMPIYAVASLGVIQSSPLTSGSQITVYLTIPAINYFNNSQIVCLTYLADDTRDDSPPAYLLVKTPAPPSAPLNLAPAAVAGTNVVLTWSPPMDLGIGGPLYYNVSYQAVSGSDRASNITTDTNITVTSLSPGTNYSMTVVSENGVSGDESKRSASINVTTKYPTNSTSSSSQVSPTTTTSLTTTTTTTPTSTLTSTSESAVGIVVGVVEGVVIAVALMVLVTLGVVVIKYRYCRRSKNSPSICTCTSEITTNDIPLSPAGKGEEKGRPDTVIQVEGFATTPLTATLTHMPSCDGVVVGMLTSSPQKEGSESKPSSNANTYANVELSKSHQITLKHSSTPPSSAVDGSTSVPTSEGSPSSPTSSTSTSSNSSSEPLIYIK